MIKRKVRIDYNWRERVYYNRNIILEIEAKDEEEYERKLELYKEKLSDGYLHQRYYDGANVLNYNEDEQTDSDFQDSDYDVDEEDIAPVLTKTNKPVWY